MTKDETQEILSEIDIQWSCHLMTKSVFPHNFSVLKAEYRAPPFYVSQGMDFVINPLSFGHSNYKLAADRVSVWLNQNYVIRLYGIIDDANLPRKDLQKYEVIKLVKILRNKVGAHQHAKYVSENDQKALKAATRLINKLFNKEIDVEQVKNFTLSVDSILKPMTEMVKEAVVNVSKKSNVLCDKK